MERAIIPIRTSIFYDFAYNKTRSCYSVSLGIEPDGVVFPSQNNNNILCSLVYCSPCENQKFLAVRRVSFDDPSRVSYWPSISSHMIRWCVRTSPPPPAVWAWSAYLTPLPGLNPQTLLHGLVIGALVTYYHHRHSGIDKTNLSI
jgi:hypothetical protein